MPSLTWDRVGQRVYQSGLEKGVLYLPDGSAVPWNGLTSVVENFDRETTPVYYDGMKISELISLGSFSAKMSAITYPKEFEILEGSTEFTRGLYLQDQPPTAFGLCYRTKVGNDLDGPDVGYRIHILYNVFAVPSDKTYASVGDDPSLVEFEWDITAIPEEIPGYRPTAHIIIDSRRFDPWLMEDLENILYGGSVNEAMLLPMPELLEFLSNWYRVEILDNGDGTWTAKSDRPGFIEFLDEIDTGLFEIDDANAIFIDEHTYQISSVRDISSVPELELIDNGDGTWTANSDSDAVIVMIDETTFEIRNVDPIFSSDDIYRITDKKLD
jgi:hypothetical protein